MAAAGFVTTYFTHEYRSPPVPLVALIGCPEHHKPLSDFFLHTLKPPLVSLCCNEPMEQFVPRAFSSGKSNDRPSQPPRALPGILKADWLTKHRQRRPAAAIAVVPRQDLVGSPAAWNRMLYSLKFIRDAVAARGAGIVVAVAQPSDAGELPPDRVTTLCHNLSLDPRAVLPFVVLEPDQGNDFGLRAARDASARALGAHASDLCAAYYARRSKHVSDKHAERQAAAPDGRVQPELCARVCVKLAVYAEFRQDWRAAVTDYQAAYGHRFAQAARLAELLQLKLVILLAYRERLQEAIAQANMHLQLFARPPVGLAAAAVSAHKGYLIRQLQITSEVLSPKLDGSALAGVALECSRAALLMAAAQVAVERRRLLEQLGAASLDGSQPSVPSLDLSAVKRGPFVGTVAQRSETGTSELSDEEYLAWLAVEETRSLSPGGPIPGREQSSSGGASLPGSQPLGQATGLAGNTPPAMDVINGAILHFRDGHTERQRARLGLLLAEEYVLIGSLSAARKLLLQVALVFRREQWDVQMVHALLLLREVAQRLRLAPEHLTYCLELAVVLDRLETRGASALAAALAAEQGVVLPGGRMLAAVGAAALHSGVHDAARLQGIIKPCAGVARAGEGPDSPSSAPTTPPAAGKPRTFTYQVEWLDLGSVAAARRSTTSSGADGKRGATDTPPKALTVADMLQQHHQQDFGWSRVLAVALAFPTAAPPDATAIQLHVAVLNALPVPISLSGADATLGDELAGGWTVPLLEELPPDGEVPATVAHTTNANGLNGLAESAGWDRSSRRSSAFGGERSSSMAGAVVPGAAQLPHAPLHPLDVQLQPGAWTHLVTRVTPRGVGVLSVQRLTLFLGQYSAVSYLVPSFPPGPPGYALGAHPEALGGSQAPFPARPGLGPLGGPSINIQHIGALPTLQLAMRDGGRAFVGEPWFVTATVQVSGRLPNSVLDFAVRPLSPGLPPSDIIITVDDRGKLDRYRGQDLARVQLPAVEPGRQHTARLWVTCTRPGRLALAVTLQCPALVTQVIELDVDQPFDLSAHLSAETGSHVLVPPASAGARSPGAPDGACHPLTVGQHALAHCSVRHCGGGGGGDVARVELLSADVVDSEPAGITILHSLEPQLVGPGGAPLLSLGPHDSALLIASLLPAALRPAPVPLGRLRLTWRRLPPESGASSEKAAAALYELEQRSPHPSREVTASLELPQVTVQDGLLSVKVLAPAQATAGISFSYTLQVQSFAPAPLELLVALAEAPGFVLSGDRAQTVTLPARAAGGSAAVAWLLVAHAAGQLTLPSARVELPRHSAVLTTQPARVQVFPF